jgi:hypothetical protein
VVLVPWIYLEVLYEVIPFVPPPSVSDIDSLRPRLDVIVERTASVPLISLFGAVLKDWMPLIDEYYYCQFFASA